MVSSLCSVPYNYVARIVQPGFKPWAAINPFLDLGCPRTLFKPEDEAACKLQETNDTDTNKTENEQRTENQEHQFISL